MNLMRSVFLLNEKTEDYLCVLYRQSGITNRAHLNFLAAALCISLPEAKETAKKLHEIGFVRYEKFGSISLTEDGRQYGKTLMQKRTEYLEKK